MFKVHDIILMREIFSTIEIKEIKEILQLTVRICSIATQPLAYFSSIVCFVVQAVTTLYESAL